MKNYIVNFKSFSINEGFGSPQTLPSNIKEWLRDAGTSEQEAAAKKVGGWAKKAGTGIYGGDVIGKSPKTLILDIKHHGSEVYVNSDGQIKFRDQVITTPKQFAEAFEKYKRSSEENRKYFKVPSEEQETAENNLDPDATREERTTPPNQGS